MKLISIRAAKQRIDKGLCPFCKTISDKSWYGCRKCVEYREEKAILLYHWHKQAVFIKNNKG